MLKRIVEAADKEKRAQTLKIVRFCGTYRFANQLLIGVRQMREQQTKKKEVFLSLLIIHLNLQPAHRVHFIVTAIANCLAYRNFQLAEDLIKSLEPNLKKVSLTPEQEATLRESSLRLEQVEQKERVNYSLFKILCPYCTKPFSFKGYKNCNKCQKDFQVCSQTLQAIKNTSALSCNACQSVFGVHVRKPQDSCPLCSIGALEPYSSG